jgi:hypothetical protein
MKAYLDGAGGLEILGFWLNPDVKRMVRHYLEQCREAKKRGEDRPEWNDLLEQCEWIIDTEDIANPDQKARDFFHLGLLVERLSHPTAAAAQTAFEKASKSIKGEQNIPKRNSRKQILKLYVQQSARIEWQKDADQVIRTGDMMIKIKEQLKSTDPSAAALAAKYLPSDRHLRAWISEVAPAYAKKPGANRQRR